MLKRIITVCSYSLLSLGLALSAYAKDDKQESINVIMSSDPAMGLEGGWRDGLTLWLC